jgi:thioredoxin reductase
VSQVHELHDLTSEGAPAEPHRSTVDVLIIGAGPVGLFAAYYSGFRGLSVAIVDSLPELGGQITAMYPEKDILDVAGFPSIKGQDLVAGLVEQAASADPTYLLGRTALSLDRDEDAGTLRVGLDDGGCVTAKALILTAGIGKFSPRPLPAAADWHGGGVAFFVPSLSEYAGKDVVIVGGGDSAFDWALALEPLATSVTLVHRRDAFRAHKATVDKVLASSVRLVTNANVTRLLGEDGLEGVEVEDVRSHEVLALPAQAVVAALGFVADLGPLQKWGLEVNKRHVVVDSTTQTNLPRVYAAGDISDYAGKVRLIAVGFGEAATAVNNAAVAIDPAAHLFPGHSSEG